MFLLHLTKYFNSLKNKSNHFSRKFKSILKIFFEIFLLLIVSYSNQLLEMHLI